MNKIKLLYITAVCLLLGSCSAWLTVNPSDKISEKDIRSNADGFHNRTNGIYRLMAGKDMYGRELTWGFVDALARYYDYDSRPNSANAYRFASIYELDNINVVPAIESLWDNTFNVIANCNTLIKDIDLADPEMFINKERERRMIKGEALGLRAMLHFDMLRLFAPSVKKDDGRKYIPYVMNFPTLIPEFLTVNEVLENVVRDLLLAKEYTAAIDTVNTEGIGRVDKRLEKSAVSFVNPFLNSRGYRLNHYAIKALLARVYLYKGGDEDKINALKYATEIINLHQNEEWFDFTSEHHARAKYNVKLYDDVIFALYNNKFEDIVSDINPNDINFLTINDYDNIFPGEDGIVTTTIEDGEEVIVDRRDYRAKYQWGRTSEKNDNFRLPDKLLPADDQIDQDGIHCNTMQPMIRLSEMYYIAAECHMDTNPTLAASYLGLIRKERGVNDWEVVVESSSDFIQLILNDVRRESYGEGQLFYFYKRLDMEIREGNGSDDLIYPGNNYVLPRPESADIV